MELRSRKGMKPINMEEITETLSRTQEGKKLLGQLEPAIKEVETKLDELNEEIGAYNKVVDIGEDAKTVNPLSAEWFKDFFDYVSVVAWDLQVIFRNLSEGYPHDCEF